MNTTQAQQKALNDALVVPADHVPAIYMQEFWSTVSVHRSSIRFMINKKKVSLDVDIFRDILQFCPKIPGQIEYKDAKKTNKMSYPRFTKIIIDYFMSKDPSISRRNKMFWHHAKMNTCFTSYEMLSPDMEVLGDGVDTQSKVPDEHNKRLLRTDDGYCDDHDDDSDDKRTEFDRDEILDPKLTNVDQTEHEEEEYNDEFYKEEEKENIDDEETMYDEEDDKVTKELYDDVNVNLGNEDTDMTIDNQGASDQQNVSQESGFEHVEMLM
ncbi:hypothetical protein Tco_0010901 [Tanacetum coccineum]